MNYVYIKYEDDLLRILEPSTTVYKLDGEKRFVDSTTGLVCAFRPRVGLGWETAEENKAFILDKKGVMVQLQDIPDQGWIKSAEYSDVKKKYYEEIIKGYFRKQMKVNTLLEGELAKYKNLQFYFGDLTVEDIGSFSEEEIMDGVAAEHRLLMRSFYKNEFSKLGQRKMIIIPPADPAASLLTAHQGRLVLDLREKVVPKRITAISPTSIPITKLLDHVKQAQLDRNLVLDINLSHCDLGDEDFVYVEQLLKYFERCQRLDLSGNRFHGGNNLEVDRILNKMLDPAKYPDLEYIDILRNPIVSINRKDLIEKLEADALKRLIWIPASFLENGAWKQMVKPDLHRIVIDTHKQYYLSQ